MKQTEKEQRKLITCYFTIEKPSIPYLTAGLYIEVLEICKISPQMETFLKTIMKTWTTNIQLNTYNKQIKIKKTSKSTQKCFKVTLLVHCGSNFVLIRYRMH